ncbi:IS3 family transposase [Gluconobacter kanchanaburiensis]|uniref:HTH-like domain-containing protein n=1 Tax=Gluconobacter kanchanaburiensis NBRC 103587 TaxID=1307948 RepID=A0A511B5D4_9PROT|nr:IS3 family transposase [Gluconobacter kanchanaburiensis]MBF0860899.1 IS3 family transposase [Gluconobacter kanchanaburiensis]GBR70012.1 hypothetical protein AA103587_1638 [Gluconobacter kanchanaburiensis NBRC 103587]GEK94923.1 hypothetical protein GKA01_01200 [Gluconobacter kanchanaburiensis NBRC 103587]
MSPEVRAHADRLKARERRDTELKPKILQIFTKNFGVYGVRWVWHQLRWDNISAERCTVARLMRDLGLTVNDQGPNGYVHQVQITLDRGGSGSDYGMGHAVACGIRPGQRIVQIFFKTWALYQLRAAQGPGAITVKDLNGNNYVLTLLNATLRNPVSNAGSKNSSIIATFDIEANPQAGGGTFRIVRAPVDPKSLTFNQHDVTVGGQNVTP